MSEKSSRNVKKRNWAFVLYPESAPSDWVDRLQQTGLQAVISPLHDSDLNADNTPKKAHYHIILVYSGPTSFSVVSALTSSLNQPIPQPLESVRGYYRYLTHKDNPEKVQYNESDILAINGFDISDYVELTRSEVNAIVLRLQQIIRDADIQEYCDFLDLLSDSQMFAEFEVASSHTILFDRYITSRRHKKHGDDCQGGKMV